MRSFVTSGLVLAAVGGGVLAEEIREPAAAFKALEESERHYSISMLRELEGVSPDQFAALLWPQAAEPTLFPRVVAAPDGSRSLRSAEVNPALAAALEEGTQPFVERNFAEAVKAWTAAVEAYPEEPMAFTHLGDAWFFQGRYDLALENYQKACAIAPDDYQPHLFRAHALARLGRREEALDAFALTLALRPRHANTLNVIRNRQAELGVTALEAGFAPRAFVRRKGDGVEVFAADAPWIAWAACKAAWLGEPEFREAGGGKEGTWTSAEEKECLAGLLGVYAGMRADGEIEPDPTIERVSAVVDAGLIHAMILYEMGSRIWPDLVLLESPEVRGKVVAYVRRFLLVPVNAVPSKP